MTEKELKKLNRYQLLELLIIQIERADGLEKQLEEARARLADRDVRMQNIGSIAEASLQLGGVFEAAQSAVELYLNAVKERVAEVEAEALRQKEAILEEARQQARQILEAAQNNTRNGN